MQEVDFIVVGGGSSGCALAARLSEDPGTTVALIEAGGDGRGWKVDMPAGVMFLLGQADSDWCHAAEPDPSLGGRVIVWPAGKMLGGGSAINGQVYIRGTRADFDAWAADGCTGWGFDDVTPYFRKAEHYEGANPPPSLGTEGPVSVSPPRHTHPLLEKFIAGFGEMGLPRLSDYNNGDQLGAFPTLATHRRGQRCSAAKAYLEPAKGRANLTIITHALAQQVVLQNGRATGVEYLRDGKLDTITARREVILSAGTFGSATLLMRSGIGPADELRAAGVEVKLDLLGVGKNLQEHPAVMQGRLINIPSYNSQTKLQHKIAFGLQYLLAKNGPLSAMAGQGLAFAKTSAELTEPDIQYHFSPILFGFDETGAPVMESRPGIAVTANMCRPYSRGRLRLRDLAPGSSPIIDHQTFQDARDMEALIAGAKIADRLFDTKAMHPYVIGRFVPQKHLQTDAEWEAFIRQKAVLAYHPVGTCRMGQGPNAVVDPELRVNGVMGLRVGDASIMPTLISANTNAASMMIGEKLADMIIQGKSL